MQSPMLYVYITIKKLIILLPAFMIVSITILSHLQSMMSPHSKISLTLYDDQMILMDNPASNMNPDFNGKLCSIFQIYSYL